MPQKNPTTRGAAQRTQPAIDSAAVREKHKQYLFPSCTNYYAEPVVLDSGHGARVRDLDGREYLDFFGGILTLSVGHTNESVNTALKAKGQAVIVPSNVEAPGAGGGRGRGGPPPGTAPR